MSPAGKFRASSVNNNQIPRTTEKLQDVIRDATSEARKVHKANFLMEHCHCCFVIPSGI